LRVKPLSPARVFAVSLVTGLGLILLWLMSRDDTAHTDHFGTTLAASLASQVAEPLMAEDMIYLGVLANRIIELPEILGATIFSVDDAMLTLSGDVLRGEPFTHPVIFDDTIVGYVRLHIDGAAFNDATSGYPLVAALLWIAMVPAFALWLGGVTIPTTLPRLGRRTDPKRPAETRQPMLEPEPCYLIVVNLFNQFSLPAEQKEQELEFVRAKADAVVDLYNGRVRELQGTGLLLCFPATDSDDRPFHVLCAAFAMSRLLSEAETLGRYRLGLHVMLLDPGADPGSADESVTDAAVLSALAKDNTMVVSEALFDGIPYPQRIDSEPMQHPLLEELETIGGGARLALSLADPHKYVVAQQVGELSYSDRSTARESTF